MGITSLTSEKFSTVYIDTHWRIIRFYGIPDKVLKVMRSLYADSRWCVKSQQHSWWVVWSNIRSSTGLSIVTTTVCSYRSMQWAHAASQWRKSINYTSNLEASTWYSQVTWCKLIDRIAYDCLQVTYSNHVTHSNNNNNNNNTFVECHSAVASEAQIGMKTGASALWQNISSCLWFRSLMWGLQQGQLLQITATGSLTVQTAVCSPRSRSNDSLSTEVRLHHLQELHWLWVPEMIQYKLWIQHQPTWITVSPIHGRHGFTTLTLLQQFVHATSPFYTLPHAQQPRLSGHCSTYLQRSSSGRSWRHHINYIPSMS